MRLDDENVKVYIRCSPGDKTPSQKPKNCESVCTPHFAPCQFEDSIKVRACLEAVMCRMVRASLLLAAGVVCFAEPMRCAPR